MVEDRRHQEGMLPEEKQNRDWKPKIEFRSELQKKLRDTFGLDVVFLFKEEKMPFGYSLIDHKTGTVYKGSDLLKMKDLFELTGDKIDKRLFESIKVASLASIIFGTILVTLFLILNIYAMAKQAPNPSSKPSTPKRVPTR